MKSINNSGKKVEKMSFISGQHIKERDYWLEKFSGELTRTSFPYDLQLTDKHGDENLFDEFRFQVPEELFPRLQKICGGIDARLHVILTAGIIVLLEKYSGSADITLGIPIYKQEVEGDFINTVLALRNRVKSTMTFKQMIMQVHQSIFQAVEHQNYPIETLLYHLDIPASDNGHGFPLFDTAVLLENIHDQAYIRDIDLNITFSFLRTEDSLEGTVKYNTRIYKKTTIEQITRHWSRLLQDVLLNLDLELDFIDLLSDDEKKRLLVEFNDTRVKYPYNQTIHGLFREQVNRTPDHIALVGRTLQDVNYNQSGKVRTDVENFGLIRLSYRELDEKSSQLANLLIEKGIQADTVVGIMMERSLEMIIGILGILKAGGGYLPIDPAYPSDRIGYILEDSRALFLVTHVPDTDKESQSFRTLESFKENRFLHVFPHKTAPRLPISDFDSLPFPDRSLLDYEAYHRYIGQGMVRNSIATQSSRGCPFHCAYCHKLWPKKNIARSAENIFAEVKIYYDMGIRRFVFIDDIFNLNRENSQRFFKLIIDNGLDVQFFFPNGVRGDLLTREYIDLMVKAGTVDLGMALETASPRLQKLIGKHLNLRKFRQNIEYLCEKYPQVILEIFFMHGFPGETEEEARLTIDFISELKWAHFAYFHILKIYPNTAMEKLAIENGISRERIKESSNLAFHELPKTLPFDDSFTLKCQVEFFSEYFLSKDRLLHVLPRQLKLLTKDELLQKYDSYLPVDVKSFEELLAFLDITETQLNIDEFIPGNRYAVPGLNRKIKRHFSPEEPDAGALRVLLLDLSQFFTSESHMLFNLVEPPLGLMYVMTYLREKLGVKICGKIAKSRIDFDNFQELKILLDEFKPDIIGIRTMSVYKKFFHQTVGMIRNWGFKIPIITGGPYSTSEYEEILQKRQVDLVVLGEGEKTFYELITKIIEKGDKQLPGQEILAQIPGLAYLPEANTRQREIINLAGGDINNGKNFFMEKSTPNLKPVNYPDDLAYIIYTSGTTGKPKGTLINHRNVVRLIRSDHYLFDFNSNDTWTLFHSFCFDFSVWEMYGALLYGGRLVIIPQMTARDPVSYLQELKKHNVTVLNQTPSAFYGLIDEELKSPGTGLNLRYVIFGGEVLAPIKLKKWREKYPRTSLINMYGITETTVHVTFKEISDEDINFNFNIIGKPIPTLTAYIMDYRLKLVPIGVAGEIYVGGLGVARGYLNQPALSGEKFITNPAHPGERLYKSGDRGRILDNGELEYLGRLDHQVKIRGYRVELGEIETHLIMHHEIKDAAVIALEEENADKYLCAYVIPGSPGVSDSSMMLREHLSVKLPDYMIPHHFVYLEQLPLTPNGKLDKNKLPLPSGDVNDSTYAAPRSPLEESLVNIWKKVLGLEKLGITDNFFHVGGDSIKAIKLINTINNELKSNLRLTDLYLNETIEQLSLRVDEVKSGNSHNLEEMRQTLREIEELKSRLMARTDIFPGIDIEDLYPMSDIEKGMVYHSLKNQDQGVYHEQVVYQLRYTAFDPATFMNALALMTAKHPILRTSFHIGQFEEEVQVVHRYTEAIVDYRHDDISQIPKNEQETYITKCLWEDRKRFFNFSQAPLWRIRTFELNRDNIAVLWVTHHAIIDGWSSASFGTELNNLYLELKAQPGFIPGKLKSTYRDYVIQQLVYKKKQEPRDFWRNELAGYQRLKFPGPLALPGESDRSTENKKVSGDKGDKGKVNEETIGNIEDITYYEYNVNLGKELLSLLNKTASQYNTNLKCLCFSAYIYMLYMLSYRDDITAGMVIHNRPISDDGEKILGCFLNTLPVRIKIPDHITWAEYLQLTDKKLLELTEYGQLSLFEIAAATGDETEGQNPFFDAIFNFVDFHVYGELRQDHHDGKNGSKADGQNENRISVKNNTLSNTLFDFTVNTGGGNFQVDVFYFPSISDQETVRKCCDYFKAVLDRFHREPGGYARKDDIMVPVEKKKLLENFNGTPVDYTGTETIHELFERQAAKVPDHTALVRQISRKEALFTNKKDSEWDVMHLTYNELNKKSNRLAHALRTKGVGPDTITAVLLESSFQLAAAILAILKTGGAYLPIDPDYPGTRLQAILEDSGAPLLLSTVGSMSLRDYSVLQNLKRSNVIPTVTSPRSPISDFDSLPRPNRTLVDYTKYHRAIGIAPVKQTLTLQTSRGCPYNCLFCHKIWPKKQVVRSAENVYREILCAFDAGIKDFVFIDDIFNLDKKNSSQLLETIARNNLNIRLYFPNGLRADILEKDFIDLMVEAGTVNIDVALESASPRIQKLIKKNLNLEKFMENVRYLAGKYPQVILELEMIQGFPTETQEEASMTFKLLKDIQWIHFPNLNILKIFPNTDMYRLAIEQGISKKAIENSKYFAYHELPDTLPFPKSFTRHFQARFLEEYFLLKERMLSVLPHQMKILTEEELIEKYNTYLPMEIRTFDDILNAAGISREELGDIRLRKDKDKSELNFNEKIKKYFLPGEKSPGSFRLLLLDLSQFFTDEAGNMLYDVAEEPLGLMYLLSYLNEQLGPAIEGKIAKSRMDFDSNDQLKTLIRDFKPHLIGIRTLSYYMDFFHRTVSLIKGWAKDTPIIAGGPYATSDYSILLQDANIDLVVLGEGEHTLLELIQLMMANNNRMPTGNRLHTVNGIAFVKDKNKMRLTESHRQQILFLDTLEEELGGYSSRNPGKMSSPADLLYLISTSGSTGTPKSVMMEQRNFLNLLNFEFTHMGVRFDRVLQFASIGFDVSAQEIFSTLLSGGEFHLAGKEKKTDIGWLINYIRRQDIRILFLPPSFLKYLFEETEHISVFPASVKQIICAGEQLVITPGIREYLYRSGICLHNHYGPAETHVVTTLALQPGSPVSELPGIGKPISNTQIYILNRYHHLQPIGVTGEIYIGGANVGRGYLNNPELTAEKFIRAVFFANVGRVLKSKSHGGRRLYATGDLGRWSENGYIEFQGRVDLQVKIRGFRVEPGEIESKLTGIDFIKEAVVINRKAGTGEQFLCAYLVLVDGPEEDLSDLRSSLSRSLPDYMIPTYFVSLERIPITPNGKVDRKRLPLPSIEIAGSSQSQPRNDLERRLVGLWTGILNLDIDTEGSIGIDDNFFDLGGHSLKATVLAARINREFDVKVPLSEIFKFSTIRALAKYIEDVGENRIKIKDYNLVSLKKVPPGAPNFFLIHDGSGEVNSYVEFCQYLDNAVNCWGIEVDKGDDVYTPRNLSLGEIAGQYIEKIREPQPQGPYYIGGWSLGGTIAFEIARQLEQMSEEIRFLAIIDSFPPPPNKKTENTTEKFTLESELKIIREYFPGIKNHLNSHTITGLNDIWPLVVNYMETNRIDIEILKKLIPGDMLKLIPNLDKVGIKELVDYVNVLRTLISSRESYIVPGKINIPIHYFGATRSREIKKEQWNNYSKKTLKIHEINGDHFSIFRPPAVIELAKMINNAIKNCISPKNSF